MSAAGARRDEAQLALEEGIRLFESGDLLGAHAHFAQAHRRAAGEVRVLSWYGLTLVLVERNSNLGMALSDQALRFAGPVPELCLNQARLHLALGQRDRAIRILVRGVEGAPDDEALQRALASLGRRRRPVIPFLRRGNLLNRLLGRLRHRLSGAPGVPEVTPAALGRLPSSPGRSDG
jgi:Flp pilus assembly protein TadD